MQCRRAEFSIGGLRGRRFEFEKRSQLVIGVSNETPSIVAVRVSNSDYRISVAAGADRGLLKATKPHSFYVFSFWFFVYSVQGGPGQPFASFMSQLRGAMQREFFLHALAPA